MVSFRFLEDLEEVFVTQGAIATFDNIVVFDGVYIITLPFCVALIRLLAVGPQASLIVPSCFR